MKKRIFKFVNIIFFIYCFSLSIGYAFFSETINFSGVARTVEYYAGPNLPITPLIMDPENNRYYSYSYMRDREQYRRSGWEDSTFSVVHRCIWCADENKKVTYEISFRNDTAVTMTGGKSSVEIVNDDNNIISKVSASITDKFVEPGETTTLKLVIKANLGRMNGYENVLGTYRFKFQNEYKYVYFDFKYQNFWSSLWD